MKAILGKKLGMTTIYATDGAQNVTLIECVPCTVAMVRTSARDGYDAVQLQAPKTARTMTRKEFHTDADNTLTVGDTITVEAFAPGDVVRVGGTTKAKGFQGVVKRHGFAGGPKTHGHRHVLRAAGSIGSRFPQKVFKGMRMAGRMGGIAHTTRGLTVVLVDPSQNLIAVKGAVPGVAGRLVSLIKD